MIVIHDSFAVLFSPGHYTGTVPSLFTKNGTTIHATIQAPGYQKLITSSATKGYAKIGYGIWVILMVMKPL